MHCVLLISHQITSLFALLPLFFILSSLYGIPAVIQWPECGLPIFVLIIPSRQARVSGARTRRIYTITIYLIFVGCDFSCSPYIETIEIMNRSERQRSTYREYESMRADVCNLSLLTDILFSTPIYAMTQISNCSNKHHCVFVSLGLL